MGKTQSIGSSATQIFKAKMRSFIVRSHLTVQWSLAYANSISTGTYRPLYCQANHIHCEAQAPCTWFSRNRHADNEKKHVETTAKRTSNTSPAHGFDSCLLHGSFRSKDMMNSSKEETSYLKPFLEGFPLEGNLRGSACRRSDNYHSHLFTVGFPTVLLVHFGGLKQRCPSTGYSADPRNIAHFQKPLDKCHILGRFDPGPSSTHPCIERQTFPTRCIAVWTPHGRNP